MAVVVLAQHAPPVHGESQGVGDDRLFEADLGTVGEAGDHGRVLSPLRGEAGLRGWCAVFVLQALDVAQHPGDEAEAFDESGQVDLHPGLISVTGGHDDAFGVGVGLEDRTDSCVQFGIHEDHVLVLLDGVQGDVSAEFHRSGEVHQRIKLTAPGQQERVVGDHRATGRHCGIEVGL